MWNCPITPLTIINLEIREMHLDFLGSKIGAIRPRNPKWAVRRESIRRKTKHTSRKLGFWCYRSDKSVRFVLLCRLFSQSSPLHRNHGKCSVSLSLYLSIYLKFYLVVAVWLPRNLHLGTRNLKRFKVVLPRFIIFRSFQRRTAVRSPSTSSKVHKCLRKFNILSWIN